ncbi:MAG: hypothetical protein FWC33_06115 [Candidatus Bathyarchaeota archaeon]|nr:hypothetical protein [Candidatus Termiticorpusculum sp.]
MAKLNEIISFVKKEKCSSAWSKGVQTYALELLNNLREDGVKTFSTSDKAKLLNGAENWKRFSDGGMTLIYDPDIAKRLSSASELKKTKNGQLNPNRRESWIDVQARALYQAELLINKAVRELEAEKPTKKATVKKPKTAKGKKKWGVMGAPKSSKRKEWLKKIRAKRGK